MDSECQIAFERLKKQYLQLPVLSEPKVGEILVFHLVVSEHTISFVLAREKECIHLVYYINKALHEVELRYSLLEKLAYDAIMRARRLRPYFLKHPVKIMSNYHLMQTLQKSETSGRMVKQVVEPSQFDIRYKPHTSIEGQALDDFVIEFKHRALGRRPLT